MDIFWVNLNQPTQKSTRKRSSLKPCFSRTCWVKLLRVNNWRFLFLLIVQLGLCVQVFRLSKLCISPSFVILIFVVDPRQVQGLGVLLQSVLLPLLLVEEDFNKLVVGRLKLLMHRY
jgi:hypothetical protein